MSAPLTAPQFSRWELAAEAIAVKMRWFGLVVGSVVVTASPAAAGNRPVLVAILALGLAYAVADASYSSRGTVLLSRVPLLISLMEALFIGLLCYFEAGLQSPFRYYYFLSLVCCSVRNTAGTTYATFAMHCVSYAVLYLALPLAPGDLLTLLLMLVVLGWVTWAGTALADLLKRVSDHLSDLNAALERNKLDLERRIDERTRELHEAQALVLHQEKMAAFGLLAAGIAHEVGNPLTSVSSLVQILQKRNPDGSTREKLGLISGQIRRIQATLRDLINFSRPAAAERGPVSIPDITREALNIARYYKRTKERAIQTHCAPGLPTVHGRRDVLVQVVLNLILNAIDATDRAGRITIRAEPGEGGVCLAVEDNGCGISTAHRDRVFRPYFTTKAEGTGLGLFVTHRLVSEHGGRVDFESTPGLGTVFRLWLPASSPVGPTPDQHPALTPLLSRGE